MSLIFNVLPRAKSQELRTLLKLTLEVKTMSKSTSLKKTKLNNLIYIAFLILIFYPPFFRGLFFEKELMPTHMFTSLIFLTYYFANKPKENIKKFSPVELGLISIVIIYIISTIFAVNMNLSIQETLKYISYLLIFMLGKTLINDKDKLNTGLLTLVVSGIVVVFIGIGSALNTFNYNGAFVKGMMNSTFQYHNAFGAYCLAVLFLCYMFTGKLKGLMKHAMGIATFVVFFGFIMSYSRGAWILLPLVGFIYYLFISVDYKTAFVSQFLGNLVGTVIIIKKFTLALGTASGWIWLFVGIGISLIISVIIEKVLQKLNLSKKVYNIIIPIVVLLLPVVALLFKNAILGLLPADLAQRIGSISLQAETVTERTVFYKDAIKIIKDHPIIGAGGGAWETLYRAYQSYAYVSTQAHNYFMQLWVEIGTMGIILFGLTLLAYLYNTVISYRKCEDKTLKNIIVAIFAAVITILIHSVIDFDLSLSAIAIFMWSLIGMQLGVSNSDGNITLHLPIKKTYILVALSIMLLIVSTSNYLALNIAASGVKAAENNELEKAEGKFKLAGKLNPFSANYKADYGQLANDIGIRNKDREKLTDSVEAMNKALELGKYDLKIMASAAKLYLKNGQFDKANIAMDNIEKYNPLTTNTYEIKSSMQLALADYYIKNNKIEEGKKLLEEIISIEEKIGSLNQEIKARVEMTNMVRFVEITSVISNNINKANKIKETIN